MRGRKRALSTADPRGPCASRTKTMSCRTSNPNPKRRNWLVLVVLAALAALLYVAVMVKIAGYGF